MTPLITGTSSYVQGLLVFDMSCVGWFTIVDSWVKRHLLLVYTPRSLWGPGEALARGSDWAETHWPSSSLYHEMGQPAVVTIRKRPLQQWTFIYSRSSLLAYAGARIRRPLIRVKFDSEFIPIPVRRLSYLCGSSSGIVCGLQVGWSKYGCHCRSVFSCLSRSRIR